MTADARRRTPDAGLAAVGARSILLTQVDVRLDVRESLGPHPLALPTIPNTWALEDGLEWLWLGPDEWLVLADPRAGAPGGVVDRLDAVLFGWHRSVVDVTAARTVFELGGGGRHDLLADGCGLDLHPRAWRDGMCAQTILARAPVILQELAGTTRVFVRPSFAGFLAAWLVASGSATAGGGSGER